MSLAALLALADSRLPAGGHAHSAGAEQAVNDRYVRDEASLATLLRRRLLTTGTVAAHLAAAACAAASLAHPSPHPSSRDHGIPAQGGVPGSHDHEGGDVVGEAGAALARLDAETDARTPAPAARDASRAQGRGLVRVARAAWPSPAWALLPRAPHHPLALGVAAAAAGCSPHQAALVAAYLSTTAPATASSRLLGLDPVTVAAVLARLGPDVEAVATGAVRALAAGEPPAVESDPLSDLLQTRHTPREDKLFAS